MLEKKVDDISIFDKAVEIDECYGDIETKAPSKYVGIRRMIIKDYKDFSIEYRKSKQPKNTFSEEFVRDELMKGDCKLISRYLCSTEKITYEYNGKQYYVTFDQWRNKGYRPHLNFYGDGLHWKDINEITLCGRKI